MYTILTTCRERIKYYSDDGFAQDHIIIKSHSNKLVLNSLTKSSDSIVPSVIIFLFTQNILVISKNERHNDNNMYTCTIINAKLSLLQI
jgi:hypothetical protein